MKASPRYALFRLADRCEHVIQYDVFEAAVSVAKSLADKEGVAWVVRDNFEHWDVAVVTPPSTVSVLPDQVVVAYDKYLRVCGQIQQFGVWHFDVEGAGRFIFIGRFSLALRAVRDLTAAIGGTRAVLYVEPAVSTD